MQSVYQQRSTGLAALFRPKHIALLGLDEAPAETSTRLLRNMSRIGLRSKLYPVCRGVARHHGLPGYPDIDALPVRPDLAILVHPPESLLSALDACVAAEIPAALILSETHSLTPPDQETLHQAIRDLSRKSKIRILGPGSRGIMMPEFGLNAAIHGALAPAGHIACVSQSGAMFDAMLDWSFQEKIGFSGFVSAGEMPDISWSELIDYFGSDPNTTGLILEISTVESPRRLLSAIRQVAQQKPVVVLMPPRVDNEFGPGDAGWDAVLHRVGALRVSRLADLFYITEILAKQPRATGRHLAIISNGGAPARQAAALLREYHGELAPLSEEGKKHLQQILPAGLKAQNPLHLGNDAGAARYQAALELLAEEDDVDGMLVILTPQQNAQPIETARIVANFAAGYKKPVIASWMGSALVNSGISLLQQNGVPCFPFPDTAARIFTQLWLHKQALDALYETPELPLPDAQADKRIYESSLRIAAAFERNQQLVSGADAASIAAGYGINISEAPLPQWAEHLTLRVEAIIHPELGPALQFGRAKNLGAPHADDVWALPPLTSSLAHRMLERSPLYSPIKAIPGGASRLVQMLLALSNMIISHRELAGVSLEPVYLGSFQEETICFVRSVNLKLHPADFDLDKLLPSAIKPYPRQYSGLFTDKSGEEIAIRPIRPEDEPSMHAFHEAISSESVYMRYFHHFKLSERVAHQRLSQLCFIDYNLEMALVAEKPAAADGPPIIGVGRLSHISNSNAMEFAVTLIDAWQDRGIGAELLRRLVEIARTEGRSELRASILPENYAMRRIAEHPGFRTSFDMREGIIHATLPL